MSSPTEVLPAAEFSQQLLAEASAYPLEETRFYRLLMQRRCPPAMIRKYACSTWLSARMFCVCLAKLVQGAPNDRARLLLLENLLEEEGMHLCADRGLLLRLEARHQQLALRFVKACGVEQEPVSNAPHMMQAAEELLSQGRWLEAVAFLLVGQELNFARNSGLIMQALLRQQFDAGDLVYFAVHGAADQRHGDEALSLVVDNAHTRAEQQAALCSAREGARHWFEMHGGARRDAAGARAG